MVKVSKLIKHSGTVRNVRMVQFNDELFWNELDHYDENGNAVYATHNGYYLASYLIGEKLVHIISLHQITSCVVRHKEDHEIYSSKEEAEKHLGDKHGKISEREVSIL